MQYGSKKISKLQYGSKNIIAAYCGSKKIWENNTIEQDINIILESIINGTELNNIDLLLLNIQSSNQDFTDINNQLEEIINGN